MNTHTLPVHSTVPVISTADVRRSIDYYVNVIGFSPDFEFGNTVRYAGVKSGDVELYIALDPAAASVFGKNEFRPEIFIWLTDIDTVFAMHVNNGADIVETISDREWGARQYVVRDINGYLLKFAQPI